MKRFTKDPVEILLTKLHWLYTLYKSQGEDFKGMDEYEVIREITDVVEMNNPANRRKTVLQLIKK